MADTTNALPYTLESGTFKAAVATSVTKAENDIKSIDAEIEALTSQFRADIMSRQARQADLRLIVAHGNVLLTEIVSGGETVMASIETTLKQTLGAIDKDLSDFGNMLIGKRQAAPSQITKAAGPVVDETLPPGSAPANQ